MSKYPVAIIVILLFLGLVVFAKSPRFHSNMPNASYTMDNGTTIQYVTCGMWESGDLYPNLIGGWRPYSSSHSTLYCVDLMVCHNSSPFHADYSSQSLSPPWNRWINEYGLDGLYRPGSPSWPPDVAVMSPHDTWASFTDEDHIGLWVGRQTMMWDNPLDADYFVESYWLKNTTSAYLTNLYIGHFSDFDFIGQGEAYTENISGSDIATRTAWMRNRQTNPTVWAGLRGLNFTVTGVRTSQAPAEISSPDEYEQWVITQLTSGGWPGESAPNDWFIMPICGPFSLAPGETKGFSFATAFGSSYADMMANLDRAKYRYDAAATIIESTSLGRIKTLYK